VSQCFLPCLLENHESHYTHGHVGHAMDGHNHVNSCNRLVPMVYKINRSWNPATKKIFEIREYRFSGFNLYDSFGFGYDDLSNTDRYNSSLITDRFTNKISWYFIDEYPSIY